MFARHQTTNPRALSCAAALFGVVLGNAAPPVTPTIIDDFSTSNPGNYNLVETFSGDGVNNFNASGGIFAPNQTDQETEVWMWTGSPERLDVGESVLLDVLTLEADQSEIAIVLGVTSDLGGGLGTTALEIRLQNNFGAGVLVARVNFGADNNNPLTGTFGPSTVSVTRVDDTTFDWEVTGSLTGSGRVSWPDAAGVPLFFGLNSFNFAGNAENQADNLAIGKPKTAFFVDVSHDPGADTLSVRWESQDGRLYNLRSETDPSNGEPATWPVFGGNQDLAATPPENVVTFPLPADPARYFVVEEFPAPPVPVFSDSFEDGEGDWTTGGNPGSDPFTNWEFGSPTVVGPAAANSPPNCFGTNLSADYADNAEIWLRSPSIDLTAASGATLNFSQDVDIEESFDFGQIRLLDADAALAELAILEMTIEGNNPAGWESFSKALPVAALGKNVVLEFRFSSDNISEPTQDGWYIDDVVVTVP